MPRLFPVAWRETFLKHPETPALALPLGGICPRTARGQVPSVLPLCGTDVAGAGAAGSSSQGPAQESALEPDRRRQGPGVQMAGAKAQASRKRAPALPFLPSLAALGHWRHWQPCRRCGICRAGVPELAKLFRKRFPAVSATCGRAAGLRAALPPAWPWLAPFWPETG